MIGVLGAGAFGTALAVSLSDKEEVRIWARSAQAVAQMSATRQNPKLAGVALPAQLSFTSDLSDLAQTDLLLLAVPMQALRGVLQTHAPALPKVPLVACCKGIELQTGLGPLDVIADILPDAHTAILTGPSFASDIARGLPTALTLAVTDGEALQARLSTPALRLYRTDDRIGASLGGALKNVMAIACGAAIGAGLGPSARAALMTRGYAEMLRYALAHGARAETLAGLSGLGDLVLTCTSEDSRNFRLGLAIGQGRDLDPSVTVEGAATARAVAEVAQDKDIEMPITQGVVALIDKAQTLGDVMEQLLTRPLREE